MKIVSAKDQFTRGRVVGHQEWGKSNREIGRLLDINHQKSNIVSKWKQEGHCGIKNVLEGRNKAQRG